MSDLPSYTPAQRQGDEGVRQLGLAIGRHLGWVVREQPTSDFGIDAHIEIVEDGLATGRLLGVQVKSGDSYFANPVPGGWRFTGDAKHLNYWRQHSLPVILVLCRPQADECFWVHIAPNDFRPQGGRWSTLVPEGNRLDEASRARLYDLASSRPVPVDLLLRSFLGDKYGSRIQVASIIESPRDWHYFTELVSLDGELCAVHIVEVHDRALDQDLLEELRKWRAYNAKQVGGLARVLLFVVAHTANTLPDPSVMHGLEAEEEGLEVIRLLLSGFDLDEVDDDGYVLMWFASSGDAMRSHRVI
jgi:hypothetical protein